MTLDDIRVEDLRVTMQRLSDEYSVIEVNARLIAHGKPQVVNVQKVGGAFVEALRQKPVGNAAAMREALENSNGLLEELAAIGEWGESAREQIAENNAALSAPARNCDVGTEDEQYRRFDDFCAEHSVDAYDRCEECPLTEKCDCRLGWAQMPYTAEEGAGE